VARNRAIFALDQDLSTQLEQRPVTCPDALRGLSSGGPHQGRPYPDQLRQESRAEAAGCQRRDPGKTRSTAQAHQQVGRCPGEGRRQGAVPGAGPVGQQPGRGAGIGRGTAQGQDLGRGPKRLAIITTSAVKKLDMPSYKVASVYIGVIYGMDRLPSPQPRLTGAVLRNRSAPHQRGAGGRGQVHRVPLRHDPSWVEGARNGLTGGQRQGPRHLHLPKLPARDEVLRLEAGTGSTAAHALRVPTEIGSKLPLRGVT